MKRLWAPKMLISIAWIAIMIFCITTVIVYPELITAQNIAGLLARFKNTVLAVYFAVSIMRGFTLIPSSPFVLAGTILFPADPFLVLAISLSGILFSSAMIYYFSDYLGFGAYLENKHHDRIQKIQNQMQKPSGLLFVSLWSFLPFLPTDAICYVAGMLRVNVVKFIAAVAFGELILCSIYVFFYPYLVSVLKSFA